MPFSLNPVKWYLKTLNYDMKQMNAFATCVVPGLPPASADPPSLATPPDISNYIFLVVPLKSHTRPATRIGLENPNYVYWPLALSFPGWSYLS